MSSITQPSAKSRLSGIVAALLTPMRHGGTRLDPEAASRLVSWLVERGIHGLYVAGTTGEGLYLSSDEHRELTRTVVKAARGIPVVVHVGALTTAMAVTLARQAVQAEASAVAAIPPSYYSLTRPELIAYFTAIGKAAEPLPVYLYNIPSHAGNDLRPELVKEIRQAVPNVTGIKDSSGFPGRIVDLVRTMGRGFDVVCGNDEKDLSAFQDGAEGIVSSGAGVFPELYLELYAAWKAGRLAEAQAAQTRIVAMQEALGNGARLGWYKYVLAQRGVPIGGVRAPLLDPTPAEQDAMRKRLTELTLL
ncbi:MAG TPA: dihydrodipicolinate synthase family protein [Candidatus Methylomirabilis sp.]|nr:dihydrodipicolinate synthase family protein [Candidatus Methylomirabilis sp.]